MMRGPASRVQEVLDIRAWEGPVCQYTMVCCWIMPRDDTAQGRQHAARLPHRHQPPRLRPPAHPLCGLHRRDSQNRQPGRAMHALHSRPSQPQGQHGPGIEQQQQQPGSATPALPPAEVPRCPVCVAVTGEGFGADTHHPAGRHLAARHLRVSPRTPRIRVTVDSCPLTVGVGTGECPPGGGTTLTIHGTGFPFEIGAPLPRLAMRDAAQRTPCPSRHRLAPSPARMRASCRARVRGPCKAA